MLSTLCGDEFIVSIDSKDKVLEILVAAGRFVVGELFSMQRDMLSM